MPLRPSLASLISRLSIIFFNYRKTRIPFNSEDDSKKIKVKKCSRQKNIDLKDYTIITLYKKYKNLKTCLKNMSQTLLVVLFFFNGIRVIILYNKYVEIQFYLQCKFIFLFIERLINHFIIEITLYTIYNKTLMSFSFIYIYIYI